MPRHHCGLQKNIPRAHLRCMEPEYALARNSGATCPLPPRGRSVRLGRPGAYRQTKTPRCLPGCL
ncbi:hypothetical protein B7G54_12460 [Burkholderia puraquae]|uniref:Uncharacterized protein n=1 Tax=Burkholderia puraquae TaxID=1904757 RepID=A0A1X1PIL7_9BURK|nr:hypothetical protein B7G54_12460 [Burkholderia puraquae]